MDSVIGLLLDTGVDDDRALLLPGDALRLAAPGGPVLVGGRCEGCGERMFPRHPVCPACMSEAVVAAEMPRHGTLYAFSSVHVAPEKWAKPFVVGYVDLANGVRVFSRLAGTVTIDGPVTLGVAEVGRDADGRPIRSFVFAAEG